MSGPSGSGRSAAVRQAILRLGGGFMLSEEAKAKGKALGTGGWGMYMIGRAGVLGDVDVDVVRAALVFFPRERVAAGWERGRAVLAPDEGAKHYAEVCHEWGVSRLGGLGSEANERLAELLERVVAAADVAALPLFAGWRAVPLPEDPAARATQLCHVLREHRGGCHGVAVLASGLHPQEAVLVAGGPGNAAFFGWPEPYPAVGHLERQYLEAEARTDDLSEPPWTALSHEEFAECARLLEEASVAAFPA